MKLVSLLLVIGMAICVVGCKEDSESKADKKEETAIAVAEWSDYTIKVVGAELFTDYNGENALRVYYDFYNNGEDTESADDVIETEFTQGGTELTGTVPEFGEETDEFYNKSLFVRPDFCIRFVDEVLVDPDGETISVVIENEYDDTETLEVELDPASLPGAPKEALEMKLASEPKWTEGLAAEGVHNDDYHIVIDSVEKAVGYNGEELIRVYFEYTNNSDEAANMWFSTYAYVFQDGIQLVDSYADDENEFDDNYEKDIEPGETVKASNCYVLKSDSPIEVEMGWGTPELGTTFNIE